MKKLLARFGVRVLTQLGIEAPFVDVTIRPVVERRQVPITVVEGPLPRGLIVISNPGGSQ